MNYVSQTLLDQTSAWVSVARDSHRDARRYKRDGLHTTAAHSRGLRDALLLAARSILRSHFGRECAKYRTLTKGKQVERAVPESEAA